MPLPLITPSPLRLPQHLVHRPRDIACNDHARHEEHGPPVVAGEVAIILLESGIHGETGTQGALDLRVGDEGGVVVRV